MGSGDEKWSDPEQILEPIGFSDVLDVRSERKKGVEGDSKMFVVSLSGENCG